MKNSLNFHKVLLTTNQLPEGRAAALIAGKYIEKVRIHVHREMADQIFDQIEEVERDGFRS
jgi:hypothetical protein